MSTILMNCQQHIKQDLREEMFVQYTQIGKLKEDQIESKVTNYLECKNQYKSLKKTRTLIKNILNFESSLDYKSLIIMNRCQIPGVGNFLQIAS